MTETLAQRFASNEITSLALTDALVAIGDRLGTPKYGMAQITALQTLLKTVTETLTNKTLDLGANTLTGSLAEFNAALQSDSFFPLSGGVTVTGNVVFGSSARISHSVTELTISGGVVTITSNFHTIDTEGDAATDDLETINGGVVGSILYLKGATSDRDVTFKDNTGNLRLVADFTFTSNTDTLTLIYDGNTWLEISKSDNA